MSYESLHAAVVPVFGAFGMDIGGPEEALDQLAVTDMVAFGLLANWMLRLLDAAEGGSKAALARLGPFGQKMRRQIERGYKKWVMEIVHGLRDAALLREVVRLGVSAMSWAQWQAEQAAVPMSQEFLDESVQDIVKQAWFALSEEGDPDEYLASLTPARLVESLHAAMREQAAGLGIPVL